MTHTIALDPHRYYTVAEYADIAKCSIYTACHRCKYGKIPGATKLHGSKSWSIPGTALLAFVIQDTPRPTVRVQAGKPSEKAVVNSKITHVQTRGK